MRGKKYNYGQVTLYTNVGNDTDLKGPEDYGHFGATNLAQLSWHLSSNTPSCTLSFPGFFLSPPPNMYSFIDAMASVGEEHGREGEGPLFSGLLFHFASIFSFFRALFFPESSSTATPGENHQPRVVGQSPVSHLLLKGRSPI